MLEKWWNENKESLLSSLQPGLKIILVPLLCYVPAFLLVCFSFSRFYRVASIPAQDKSQTKIEIEKIVKNEVDNEFTMRRKIPKIEGSDLARDYLKGQIKTEAKEQAENAAKDAVDKVKGDLFGQISFPVLFTIASIFAAFAVKDILTEILKDQEKAKVKQELKKELLEWIDNAVQDSQEEMTEILNSVQVKTDWLEYEFLNISMTKVMDELAKCSKTGSNERVNDNISTLESLIERSTMTLNRLSSKFDAQDLEILIKADSQAFQENLKSTELSESLQNILLSKLPEKSLIPRIKRSGTAIELENPHSFTDEIFKIQIRLVINTLRKRQEIADESEKQVLENLINEFKKYAFTDKASAFEKSKRDIEYFKSLSEKRRKNNPS